MPPSTTPPPTHNHMESSIDPLLGIYIEIRHQIMVDSDDGSSIYHAQTQDRPDSPPPILLRSIWDCPGITLDQIEDDDGKIIPGWRCGYCPIPGGLGPPPFFKYRNATKALSHLSSRGEDIITCKGLKNIPSNVRNALNALKHYKLNQKSERLSRKNTLVEEVSDNQANVLSSQLNNTPNNR